MDKHTKLVERLKQFDTPSITNVLATYPDDKELCMGLYNPWECDWYTDETIKCMFPELGRMAGYAVTAVFTTHDPNFCRLSFADILRTVDQAPKPVILVIKQKMPKYIKKKSGLAGGNMTTALQSIGCIGCISDGPSRDIDEIRPMKFQYMLTGTTAGHGPYTVSAVNVPVNVGGMTVSAGDIIHMDENGAVCFPETLLEQILEKAAKLQIKEKNNMEAMRKAENVEDIIKILQGY